MQSLALSMPVLYVFTPNVRIFVRKLPFSVRHITITDSVLLYVWCERRRPLKHEGAFLHVAVQDVINLINTSLFDSDIVIGIQL